MLNGLWNAKNCETENFGWILGDQMAESWGIAMQISNKIADSNGRFCSVILNMKSKTEWFIMFLFLNGWYLSILSFFVGQFVLQLSESIVIVMYDLCEGYTHIWIGKKAK